MNDAPNARSFSQHADSNAIHPQQDTIQKGSEMPRIIIGNVDSEYMNTAPERLDWATLCTDSAVANRLAWYLADHCALVLPSPATPEFLSYVAQLTGVDAATVTVISPADSPIATPKLLTRTNLFEPAVMSEVVEWAKNSDGTAEVLAYLYDPNVSRLAEAISARPIDDTAFVRGGGAIELNQKSVFKRTAKLLGIPQPEGTSVDTPQEMAATISRLLTTTGRVIVKMNSAAGGDGNTLIYVRGRACPGIGTVTQIEVDSGARDDDIESAVAMIWGNESGGSTPNQSFVVEEYHANAESYYAEFYVPDGHRSPELRNFGRMRMEPVWNGFEIPSDRMSQVQAAQFCCYSNSLAHHAQHMGYAGLLNVDGLVTEDGKVLVNEFNGRYGGCSHIDHISRQLYGDSYANKITIVSKNHVPTTLSFVELAGKLNEHHLAWDPGTRTGCIIATEDCARTQTFEYIAYAQNPAAATQLETAIAEVATP
ncbi:preATP grasp domain-containing protein [Mycobacterium sp. BMJ-28]